MPSQHHTRFGPGVVGFVVGNLSGRPVSGAQRRSHLGDYSVHAVGVSRTLKRQSCRECAAHVAGASFLTGFSGYRLQGHGTSNLTVATRNLTRTWINFESIGKGSVPVSV